MKPKKRIYQSDYIKANRIASREAEIENHGHPLCHKIMQSRIILQIIFKAHF